MKKKESTEQKKSFFGYFITNWQLYLLLAPLVIYLLIFNYYPMIGLQIAFKDWKIRGGIWGSPWATTGGALDLLKHFKVLFNDPNFYTKFQNTVRIATLRTVIGFPVPIIITIFLNEMLNTKFKKVTQTVIYFPHFISWIIISGILISMTMSGTPLQLFFKDVFKKELHFFSDDNLFILMLIVSSIWKGAGWGTIIYFAAISGIEPSLYEAAEIDGAGRWQRMKYITIPGLLPAISINLILSVDGLIQGGFDQVFNMYNPAVYGKGDILETYLYRIGIAGGNYDVATAIGLFNSLIAFALTILSNYLVRRKGGNAIW